MLKLIAAAIKYYPIDSKYPQIVCAERHCDCFEWMFKHQVEYDRKSHQQGFLTSENQFVDRYEAMEIAHSSKQILEEDYQKGKPLFSEDIW